MNKTIAIDFDGVIHKYSKGWHDGSIYDEPMEGVREAISHFKARGFKIVVFTCRDNSRLDVSKWIIQKFGYRDIEVTNVKPQALIYIDDRGLRFENWSQTMKELIKLKIL